MSTFFDSVYARTLNYSDNQRSTSCGKSYVGFIKLSQPEPELLAVKHGPLPEIMLISANILVLFMPPIPKSTNYP